MEESSGHGYVPGGLISYQIPNVYFFTALLFTGIEMVSPNYSYQ